MTAAAGADPAQVVTDFLEALAVGDAETAIALVADDLIYENVSLPTIRGKQRFARGARTMVKRKLGFDVRIHRIAAAGTTVLTERTDTFTINGADSPVAVMGSFDLRDGKIVAWRDYFDMGLITKMMSGEAVDPAVLPVFG